MNLLNPNLSVFLLQGVSAIGWLICALEILYRNVLYKDVGLFGVEIARSDVKITGVQVVIQVLLRYRNFFILVLVSAIASIILLVCAIMQKEIQPLLLICCFIIFLTSFLLNQRLTVGLDGADQMALIIFFSLTLYWMTDDQSIKFVSILNIAAQSALSYFISGFTKLFSSKWTRETAIFQVLSTQIYGSPMLISKFKRFEQKSRLLAILLIAFEISFPLILIIPFPYYLIYFFLGFVFHLSAAFLMGLNTFFWFFIATYPAIYIVISNN